MNTYAKTLRSVKKAVKNGSFAFHSPNEMDYTGVGFGYNLQNSYPRTMQEAEKDMEPIDFGKIADELL